MNTLSLCFAVALAVVCVQGQRCPPSQCDMIGGGLGRRRMDQCTRDLDCCQGKSCCPDPLNNCALACIPMRVQCPARHLARPGICATAEACNSDRDCLTMYGPSAVCCPDHDCGMGYCYPSIPLGAVNSIGVAPGY